MTELSPDDLQLAFHEVECATYDERFGIAYDATTVRDVERELGRLVPTGRFERVLDVGCGTGYLGLGLAAAGRVDELHASDLSPGMLERTAVNARRLGVDVRLTRATAAALPFPDATFDAVLSRGVLHHLHDPVAALAEWRRVARPGAPVVVLSEPTPHADRVGGLVARGTLGGLALARRAAAAVGRPLSAHDADADAHHRYWDLVAMAANLHTFTPGQLATLARAGGFDRVVVRGAGLASIAWAAAYYVVVGALPDLAASTGAKRQAGRAWAVLRQFDAALVEPLLPAGALLTVQGVFRADGAGGGAGASGPPALE